MTTITGRIDNITRIPPACLKAAPPAASLAQLAAELKSAPL